MCKIARLATALAAAAVLAACATSPTGQSQLQLFSSEQLAQMGAAAYQDIQARTPVSRDGGLNRYVSCVARSITGQLSGSGSWEVTVFASNEVNAFALPGGKIGVYSGMLRAARDQHQLATVIAHEVGHVLADHANARMSANYATSAGLQLVQVLAGGGASAQKQRVLGLLGLGAQVGILMPYGRGQESEADVIGLELMARAGFDPRASISLWRNMEEVSGGGPPQFLSTHPSHESRINTLQQHMPTAIELFRQARSRGRNPSCG